MRIQEIMLKLENETQVVTLTDQELIFLLKVLKEEQKILEIQLEQTENIIDLYADIKQILSIYRKLEKLK